MKKNQILETYWYSIVCFNPQVRKRYENEDKKLLDGLGFYSLNKLLEFQTGKNLICKYIDYVTHNHVPDHKGLFVKRLRKLGEFNGSGIYPVHWTTVYRDNYKELNEQGYTFVTNFGDCRDWKEHTFYSLPGNLVKQFSFRGFPQNEYDLTHKHSSNFIMITKKEK